MTEFENSDEGINFNSKESLAKNNFSLKLDLANKENKDYYNIYNNFTKHEKTPHRERVSQDSELSIAEIQYINIRFQGGSALELTDELKEKYLASSTGAEHFLLVISDFSKQNEDLLGPPEINESADNDEFEASLAGLEFTRGQETSNGDLLAKIRRRLQLINETYLLDKGDPESDDLIERRIGSSYNEEEHELLDEEIDKYLGLVMEAIKEGDLGETVSVLNVFQLVKRNIEIIAYQDRIDAQNLLGDHGIRHILKHNITAVESILNCLKENGQSVRAIDVLMGHQIMIMHDIGYTTEPINQDLHESPPRYGGDKGHNVLSARIFRELCKDAGDPLVRVFSDDQIRTIHEGILWHDSSELDFHISEEEQGTDFSTVESREDPRREETAKIRRSNLLSAIHLADNTSAFEEKLPELLYSAPETFEYMKILITLEDLGTDGSEEFKSILESMTRKLKSRVIERCTPLDANALIDAITALEQTGEKRKGFSRFVGRICGTDPIITIDQKGIVTIEVTESPIHQKIMQLYGFEEYGQLKNFTKDLIGHEMTAEELDSGTAVKEDSKIIIKIRKANTDKGSELTLTEKEGEISALIDNKAFGNWLVLDNECALELNNLQGALLALDQEDGPEAEKIKAKIKSTTEQRLQYMRAYLA